MRRIKEYTIVRWLHYIYFKNAQSKEGRERKIKNKWEKHSEGRLKPIHIDNYINYECTKRTNKKQSV